MSTPKEIVDRAIADNTIVMFAKSWCPYSKKAKKLLKDNHPKAELVVFELDERQDGGELQNYLLEKTKQRTVPNIFIKKQHIGGSDDLAALESDGGISALLTPPKTIPKDIVRPGSDDLAVKGGISTPSNTIPKGVVTKI